LPGGADRAVGQRRDPQPQHRLATLRGLVGVTKDQLTLTTRVTGIDHILEALVAQQTPHHAPLLAGALARPQLEALGNHRQRVERPALPGRVVVLGALELEQVPDTPGDTETRALQVPLMLAARPQHAPKIARN